jgi:hypothetical protein
MIEVQGAVRQVTHNAYQVDTVRDVEKHEVGLVFVLPGGEAHVFSMPEENAKQLEDSIRKARTGIVPAVAMPGNGNGG